MLRSKENSTSTASNKMKVKVGNYEYWFDMLNLKVYDENDMELSIKDLFELIITNQKSLIVEQAFRLKQDTIINAKIESNRQCQEAINALMTETLEAMNNQVEELQSITARLLDIS